MMMVLSRFSMNSAAATGAVICMARRCRSGSSSLRTREIKACRALLFDRSIISPAICLWESATQRIALQHGPARLPADVSSWSLSYGCNPISQHGNRPVMPRCFNPEAATTTAQSGKRLQ
jgi:hypothetical protein